MLATLALSAQEKEAALGAGLAKDILRRTTPIESSTVREYVTSLGRQLASQLPDTGLNWTFTPVLDAEGGRTNEPIAVPGGFVFVSARLILEARDEAEFAGMLAHAMVHVSERHGFRAATRGQIANLGSIPLIFVGGWASPVGFLKSYQPFELEADRLAVRMMDDAGYDPAALLRYLDRSSPPADRRAALEQAIQALPPATYSSPNEEFQGIQEEVRRLMPVRRPPSLYHP
jgi:predicted Zn-dependent protease